MSGGGVEELLEIRDRNIVTEADAAQRIVELARFWQDESMWSTAHRYAQKLKKNDELATGDMAIAQKLLANGQSANALIQNSELCRFTADIHAGNLEKIQRSFYDIKDLTRRFFPLALEHCPTPNFCHSEDADAIKEGCRDLSRLEGAIRGHTQLADIDLVRKLEGKISAIERKQKNDKPLTKTGQIRKQRLDFCCPRYCSIDPKPPWSKLWMEYSKKFPDDKCSPDSLGKTHRENCPKCKKTKP